MLFRQDWVYSEGMAKDFKCVFQNVGLIFFFTTKSPETSSLGLFIIVIYSSY